MVSRLVAAGAVAVLVIIGLGIFVLSPQLGQTTSSSTSPVVSSSSGPSSTTAVSTLPSSSSSQSAASSSSSSSSSRTAPSTTSSSSSSSSATSSTTSSSTSTTVAPNNFRFLIFTQKGIVELVSPDGTLLGYQRLYTIPNSIPIQTGFYYEYPQGVAPKSNFLLPLNNGTVSVVDGNTMAVQQRLSVGTTTGFIGVTISPDLQSGAIADGPSGIVTVIKLSNAETVWKQVFNKPDGSTAFPCDVRWSPDGKTLAVPMRNNGTIVALDATNGKILSTAVTTLASQPYMLTINWQGNVLAVEIAANKTVAFYSYPQLKPLGVTSFSISTFTPVRGIFTPDGKYYLEGGATTNVVEVISTTTFSVVNTINLPATGAPGVADFELTPDGLNALFVVHGNPTTGGIIFFIPIANIATVSAATASIPLTTGPALVIPISVDYATYLADNVLSPPVTGLHC